jgi:hypothetical protein
MFYPTGWRIVSSEGANVGLGLLIAGVSGSVGSFFLEHAPASEFRRGSAAAWATAGSSTFKLATGTFHASTTRRQSRAASGGTADAKGDLVLPAGAKPGSAAMKRPQ